MIKVKSKKLKIPKIYQIENKCNRIHKKIIKLQSGMKEIKKSARNNIAWKNLFDSAVCNMDEALNDFENKLNHICSEVKEFK